MVFEREKADRLDFIRKFPFAANNIDLETAKSQQGEKQEFRIIRIMWFFFYVRVRQM